MRNLLLTCIVVMMLGRSIVQGAQRHLRVSLSVATNGECLLIVESTSKPISSASTLEGKKIALRQFPNTDVVAASDGRTHMIHSFQRSDPVNELFPFVREGVDLDRSLGVLNLKSTGDRPAHFAYWSQVAPPLVIAYDRVPMQTGSASTLYLSSTKQGMLSVNLARRDDSRIAATVYWDDPYDLAGRKSGKRVELFQSVTFAPAKGLRRKFTLPLPASQPAEGLNLGFIASSDQPGHSQLFDFLIEGRFHPILGVQLRDGPLGVVVDKVLPGSLAERNGLQSEDVILKINGQTPRSQEQALSMCRRVSLGDEARFLVRRNGQEREATIAVK